MGTDFKFRHGKTVINEIQLPTLHIVAVTQWTDVIGDAALVSWLKFFSWSKQDEGYYAGQSYQEVDAISSSFTAIAKKLGVGVETLKNKIIQPLWEVGLIDVLQNDIPGELNKQQLTIIVYRYPRNDIGLSFQPIVKFRDYEKDYRKNSRVFHQRDAQKTSALPISKTEKIDVVLNKHMKRLNRDKVDVTIIKELWEEEEKRERRLEEFDFAHALDKAIQNTPERIGSKGSVKGYFITVLKRARNSKFNSK